MDAITAPSAVDPKGVKTYAQRKDLATACPAFHDLIVTEMARSAAALAQLWEKAYVQANSPDLSKYASYRYPLDLPFTDLDYLKALP